LFLFLGEVLVRMLSFPIPGNVVGMVLLTLALVFDIVRLEDVEKEAELLVRNMSVMFIPPGVGIVLYWGLIKSQAVPIFTALIVSFLVTIILTAKLVESLRGKENEQLWHHPNFRLILPVLKALSEKEGFYLNPVLLSILSIAIILKTFKISYQTYMESAQLLSFLLGPAVVSLAVPLYKQRDIIKAYAREIGIGIAFGGTLAILSAFYVAKLLRAEEMVLLSIAPKSITTAIAIGVSEKMGSIPALTAVLVILTGIMGNAIDVEVLNAAGVKDKVARGLAMGVTSHGLGTARIILDDELAEAVSGLAMALNGIFTSIVLPCLVNVLKYTLTYFEHVLSIQEKREVSLCDPIIYGGVFHKKSYYFSRAVGDFNFKLIGLFKQFIWNREYVLALFYFDANL